MSNTKKIFTILVILPLFFSILPAISYADNTCPPETPACKKIIELPSTWKEKLTLTAVMGGAIIDAINPCEFAILILLMGTLLLNNNKKRALQSGLAFCLAVFLAYFAMGVGLLKIIQDFHISFTIIRVVGALSIILGLLHLKDYIKYEPEKFVMEVPTKWRPTMKNLIKGVTNPLSAFLIGLLISVFLLPCTSGPYIIILTLLSNQAVSQLQIFLYLLLYNSIFILPMLFIVFLMYFGLQATRAESWRKDKIRLMHLIASIILTILGLAILMKWI